MKLKSTCLLFLALVFIACGGSNVQTVKTTDKDLSNYETFAYLPNSNVEVSGMDYNNEDINAFIIESINNNMQQQGYKLDRDNPDLLVLVSTSTDEEMARTTDPVYARYPYTAGVNRVQPFYSPYYYRGYNTFSSVVGYDTDTYQYTEGTLVINLVDRETKEVVWKGIASDNIYNQTNIQVIEEMVNEIFSNYPAKS